MAQSQYIPGLATEAASGVVELATTAETAAGEDASRATVSTALKATQDAIYLETLYILGLVSL